MRLRTSWGFVAIVLGVFASCGDDDGGGAGGGSGGGSGGGFGFDAGSDAGPISDGNDGIDEAKPLTLGVESDPDVIATPGDVDYFTFEGTAGQWVMIVARATSLVEPMIRPRVTLQNPDTAYIANPDVGTGTTLALPTRLPATGTYYLSVQDRTSTVAGDPLAGPTYTYVIEVTEIPASADGFTRDVEDNDIAAQAQTLDFMAPPSSDAVLITGGAIDAADLDVYSFDATAVGPQQLYVLIYPSGLAGNGSTGAPSSLSITNSAGTQLVARVNPAQTTFFAPVLDPANYLLWVDHPVLQGTNDFYFVRMERSSDLPVAEAAEVANGTIAGAEALSSGALFAGKLGAADTDHVSIAATSGQTLSVECRSRVDGSGVIGLDAALFASTDTTGTTELAGAAETDTAPLAFDYVVPADGTYVLRLTKGSQDGVVVGDWYTCTLTVM